eukprot:m.55314 g.55314  ORF g.55314 m.55314 type:complete len:356 (+) comp12523_c0_seq3:94-1161(+)
MGNTSSGRQDAKGPSEASATASVRQSNDVGGGAAAGAPVGRRGSNGAGPLTIPSSSAPVDIPGIPGEGKAGGAASGSTVAGARTGGGGGGGADGTMEVGNVFGSPLLSGIDVAEQQGFALPPVLADDGTAALAHVHQDTSGTIPYVFTWSGSPQTEEVGVTGSFNNWGAASPLRLKSPGLFEATLYLTPSVYEYKFVVDGEWQHDENAPCVPNGLGSVNNVLRLDSVFDFDKEFPEPASPAGGVALRLNESDASLSSMVDGPQDLPMPGTPPGDYGQEVPNLRAAPPPPTLPPQLLQVTLNSDTKGNDPTELPVPGHVMLNHLYALSIRDKVMVLGASHRYRKKYVTTVLYKPVP